MPSYKSLLIIAGLTLTACASEPPKDAENGPVIMNARANPETVVMDNNFQPKTQAEILVEVQDFKSDIQEVRVSFKNVPLEIALNHLSGTTWNTTLTPEQLKMLAIGDQTTNYDLTFSARDASGRTRTVTNAASIKVKGPDLKRKL